MVAISDTAFAARGTVQTADTALDYPAFDWLRMALATGVFLVHAGSVEQLNFAGDMFVQVFFALSGFLIGGILLRMQAPALPRFFYNRVTRIWFPYFAAVLLLYGIAFLKDGPSPYFWQSLAFDLTLTHNLFIEKPIEVIQALPMNGANSHFWTIAVEEQAYLIAPLLILFVPLARFWGTWVVITAFATANAIGFGSVSAGILAAILQLRYGDWHTRPWAIMGLATVGALACLCWATDMIAYRNLVPVMSIVVVLLLAHRGPRTKLGKWVGGISFPFYLNHWLGIFFANALFARLPQLTHPVADAIGFGVAVGLAALAYRLIDVNVQTHRAQLYSPALGRVAMVSAYLLLVIGLTLGLTVIGPLSGPPPG